MARSVPPQLPPSRQSSPQPVFCYCRGRSPTTTTIATAHRVGPNCHIQASPFHSSKYLRGILAPTENSPPHYDMGSHSCNDDNHSSYTSSGHSSPQTPARSPSVSTSSRSSQGSSQSSPPLSQHSSTGQLQRPEHLSRDRWQPRIRIESLLHPGRPTYHLEVVQHPMKTAEYGDRILSRLPLTPPIIAKLIVKDPTGNMMPPSESEVPFLVACLSLYSENGTRVDTAPTTMAGSPPMLYGNLVSTLDELEDLQGNMGLFFLFPDVSIRRRGRFQIEVTLMRLSNPETGQMVGESQGGTILTGTRTRPFDVLPYHQYIAYPPTRLTQSFVRQGARMFTYMSHP